MRQGADVSMTEPAAMKPVRIVIVEDHRMVASALAATLDAEDGLSVLATVSGAVELAAALAEHHDTDVVLLDLRLADGVDATELVPGVRAACPAAKVIVLSAWSDDRSIARVIESGCDGYLLKDQQVGELVDAIHAAMNNEPVFAPAVMKRVVALLSPGRASQSTLSARELDVLQRLGDGCSTAEISGALFVSVNTVRNHVQSIMQKLGVHSRLEAVAHAVRAGLITVR